MKTYIIVKTRFEAIHCWPDCPFPGVHFLTYPHRHEFHVELKCKVFHLNRDLEFFMVKKQLEKAIPIILSLPNIGSMSCEMIAKEIGIYMKENESLAVKSVSVFEDGENGTEVEF